MATTLSVNTLRHSIGWTFEDVQTFGNSSNSNSFTYSKQLTNGTGAGSANKIYVVQDDTGLAGSGTSTLDLQGLTNMFDDATSFSKVKALYIENGAAVGSGANLVVGNAASNQWGGATAFISATDATVLIPGGGSLSVVSPDANGYAVTAGMKDLKLANASTNTALPYKLVIIGE